MVTIALIILIPVMCIVTGYFTLKAYQTGLAHSWELKHDIKPTQAINPIVQIYEDKQTEKQQKEQIQAVNEYLYDPRDDE